MFLGKEEVNLGLERADSTMKRRSCSLPSASWRFCVAAGAISSFIVCGVNLGVTVWGALTYQIDNKGQGLVYEGHCAKVRKYNIVIHLAINSFATILLGASNYCMQCLSAPTRAEIDRAHAQKVWLDIGVPSFRNLRYISKKRAMMWCLLSMTSLPLHLLYNSTYFSSISVNDYKAIIVRTTSTAPRNVSMPAEVLGLYDNAQAGRLEPLRPRQCIDAYKILPRDRGNLVLLVNESSVDTQLLPASNDRIVDGFNYSVSPGNSPQNWICNGICKSFGDCSLPVGSKLCDPDKIGSGNWTVDDWPISGCFSEKTQDRCRIFFSLPLAIVVIAVNAVKVVLFCFSLVQIKETPLLCVGDAIVEFMRIPDTTTEGMGPVSRKDFGDGTTPWKVDSIPKRPTNVRQCWSKALSRRTWGTFMVPLLGGVGACLFLLLYAVGYGQQFNLPLMLGFGSVDIRALVGTGASGVVGNVLFANMGQVFLSIFYVSYNSLLTSLLLAYEWNQYSQYRKGLRVSSDPTGSQRSTYFLQLPYRFSIPFQVIWALLHWLISQSIYLVSLERFHTTGNPSNYVFPTIPSLDDKGDNQILTCGYSPVGIGATLFCGLAALICLKVLGRKAFAGLMPIAGSCSAAISAACHVARDEPEDASTKPVKWGVLYRQRGGPNHCGFSSLEVGEVESEQYYR